MNFDIISDNKTKSTPSFSALTLEILDECNALSITDIKKIMLVSDKIAELNYERFQQFNNLPIKEALFAYDGDVYQNMNRQNFTEKHLSYAQNN